MIWATPVYDTRKMYVVNKRCKVCGRKFFIKDDEMFFYVQNELKVPNTCYFCRQEKKQKRERYGV